MDAPREPSPTSPEAIAPIVHRNIRALIVAQREREARERPVDRVLRRCARSIGSLPFLALNLGVFAAWLLWNTGAIGLAPFDPFPFTLLTAITCIETILLTCLVLLNQNRMTDLESERADLHLQVDLLAEHEITRALALLVPIAERLGVDAHRADVAPLARDTRPEDLLRQIERERDGEAR